ncbi:MAG: hypothetical protein WCS93_02680 [Candidatus Delongbacteria bacterium]|jgi:hypothetical protein|nr:hypothetical protein [Candidatus Delongbacteria bacterium]
MRFISLMLILGMLYSCSKTVLVSDGNYEAVRLMINQEALQKTCHMTYEDKTNSKVHALNIGKDSVKFVTDEFKLISLPVTEVKTISFTDRSAGAGDGALTFFVAGSLFGVLRLASAAEGSVSFMGYCLFAAIYGLPFSAVGMVGGSIVGSSNIFDFSGMNGPVQFVTE